MGADGGICWVYLAQPYDQNREKLQKLLPWSMLTWDSYYDDIDEGVGHDYFRSQIPDNTLYATYGTGIDCCLSDLNDILGCEEAIVEDWGSGEVTLAELLECAKADKTIRREWYHGYYAFNVMLLSSFTDPDDTPVDVLLMTVTDWCAQVRACCQSSIYGVLMGDVETWT